MAEPMFRFNLWENSMNSQRVAIFVDVLNLFYAAKFMHQSKVDYRKLLTGILDNRELVKANAYIIQRFEANQQTFYDALKHMGFSVKVKDVNTPNGEKRENHETWISQITIDALNSTSKVDTIIIVSGDGNYADLAAHLRTLDVKVEVVGIPKTISAKLASKANKVTMIDPAWLTKEPKFESVQDRQPRIRESAVRNMPDYDNVQPNVPNQPSINQNILV